MVLRTRWYWVPGGSVPTGSQYQLELPVLQKIVATNSLTCRIENEEDFKNTLDKIPDYKIRPEEVRYGWSLYVWDGSLIAK